MRMHIELDDKLVARIDQQAGPRHRSDFVRRAVTAAVDEAERWDKLLSAAGSIDDFGHEWDEDPAAWVAQQRRLDPSRTG